MGSKLKIKVCGMKYPANIEEVQKLNPDYLGFIFYPGSPRYMVREGLAPTMEQLPASIQKVGVFVDAEISEVLEKAREYGLNLLQLHGDESPDQCERLRGEGFKVIKVFRMEENFDFSQLIPFERMVDFFLFDTKGPNYGGSGIPFDWDILKGYSLSTPYFLSGGVGPENIRLIKNMNYENLVAIDVNSRVEKEPGLKDIGKIARLKVELKKLNH